MISLRPLFAIVIALILAASGHSMAAARGASDATGQMVLCTGTGPVTVYMDADGNPTHAPHLCPDCLAPGFDALSASDSATGDIVRLPVPAPVKGTASPWRASLLAYLSRAPPLSI